jgi:hypothetical protein
MVNKALRFKVSIILSFILGTEGFALWREGITLPPFLDDDFLHAPKTIDIILEYVLDMNHWLPPQ